MSSHGFNGPKCPYCGTHSMCVGGAVIYPHRPDLHKLPFWACRTCDAYVGCHPGTQKPLGFPANAELRKARSSVHGLLDPIWKSSKNRGARVFCYRFLADKLGREFKHTHTAQFSLEDCKAAVAALRGLTFGDVLKHREAALAARHNMGGFE